METQVANITIRPATMRDVVNSRNRGLKMGLMYFTTSVIKPGTLCGPQYTTECTDKKEFKKWFRDRRIWVPVSALDNNMTFKTETNFQKAG